MDERTQKILDQANALFMQYGVKSLTMDDLARHMGISKKTLYQVVSDKNELVVKGMQCHMERDQCDLMRIHTESKNAIDEMFHIAQHVSQHLQQMHPSIMYDLEKYYPEAFQLFQQHKQEVVMTCVAQNMEQGIKQGLYRSNLNIPIISGIYIGRMEIIFDQQLFPMSKYTPKQVYLESLRYHIRGIASEKGMEYLKDKFRTLDTQNPIF